MTRSGATQPHIHWVSKGGRGCLYVVVKGKVNTHFHLQPLGYESVDLRGLLEKYPTFGREKETGLLGALDT